MYDELIELKPNCPMPEDELDRLRKYANEDLCLEREIPSFTHKLHLRLKRTPKLQLLFDLIREASEAHRGINEGQVNGTQLIHQRPGFYSCVKKRRSQIYGCL
jgi:hypothetical protein